MVGYLTRALETTNVNDDELKMILQGLTCEMKLAKIPRMTIKKAADKIRKISYMSLNCVKEVLDYDEKQCKDLVEHYDQSRRRGEKLDMIYNMLC